MKKVTDFLKPNILIILGALLLLVYINLLQGNGAALAIGLVAVIFASYYLLVGILGLVLGNRISGAVKNGLDVVSACLFPILMFVITLIDTINNAQGMGPTAWIIAIIMMISSIALAAIYALSKFANVDMVNRFAYLFAAIFVLALLLDLLFTAGGATRTLGNISVITVVIYFCYCFFLFNSLGNGSGEANASESEGE